MWPSIPWSGAASALPYFWLQCISPKFLPYFWLQEEYVEPNFSNSQSASIDRVTL